MFMMMIRQIVGVLRCLGNDVVEEYQMLTGEKIDLFLDQYSIEWGKTGARKSIPILHQLHSSFQF